MRTDVLLARAGGSEAKSCHLTQFRRLNERATSDAGGVWIPRAPPGLSRWVKKR